MSAAVMIDRVSVRVLAADPVSRAGIASQLRTLPELAVTEGDGAGADVSLVVVDVVDDLCAGSIRRLRVGGCSRVLVVAGALDDTSVLTCVEAGACGVVRRSDATADRLHGAVMSAAAGDGTLPPDMLGRLLEQVQRLQHHVLAPRGLTLTGLSSRETDVLRLVAEGFDTKEVAEQLCYSERTIKNIVHDLITRLQLRNRAHAVAYAVRHGLI